jgi:hypothetical protein
VISFQLVFIIRHQEGPRNKAVLELNGTHQLPVCADVNLLCENKYHKEKQRSSIRW